MYPTVTCSVVPWHRNLSLSSTVEGLNLTCSETLSNLMITLLIQRSVNAKHRQEYHSFSNSSINITIVETPSHLTYRWSSLPGKLIVKESFPHFVAAEFTLTYGAARTGKKDLWQVSMQSIDDDRLSFNGTF